MNAKLKTLLGVLTLLWVGLATTSADAQRARLDIKFTDPVINDLVLASLSSLQSDLILPEVEVDLPPEVNAVFFLDGGRTSNSGATTYVLSDVRSASVPFRDAEYTVMNAFRMVVQADQTIDELSWTSNALSTPTVIDQVTMMNSPLFIQGRDRLTGETFSYTYRESEATFTAVPEPSALACWLGIGLAGVIRRRRSGGDF